MHLQMGSFCTNFVVFSNVILILECLEPEANSFLRKVLARAPCEAAMRFAWRQLQQCLQILGNEAIGRAPAQVTDVS